MNIFDVIHQYREGIERSEVGMLRDLARLWVPSYRYLKQQVKDLMTVIQAQRDRGEPVWIGYLHSMERYQSMMEQARRTIDAYNRAALGRISGEEADAVEIGSETARKLVNIAAANDPLWIRVNKREGRILSGMLSEMSPLRALLDKSWPETSRKLDEVLTVGLTTGQGSNWIAQRMMEAVTIPEKRALLIARTEVNRTYREANLETMRESRAVIGYRRMCYPPTACFACLEMDGEFYEKGESFSDHPNGKCSAVPVTKHFDPINDPNWERGQQWFERQSEETQRKIMGPGRFDLWKKEGVNPRDMVYIKENPLWGGSPTMKTLEEIRKINILYGSSENQNDLPLGDRMRSILGETLKSDPVSDIELINEFGEKTEISEEMARKLANSKYNLSEDWGTHNNCQRCVPVEEMRLRGFDVVAKPCPGKFDYLLHNFENVWTNVQDEAHNLVGNGRDEAIEKLLSWGDGARAEISVKWKNSQYGHVFIGKNKGGKIIFEDPQLDKTDVLSYFDDAEDGLSGIIRIDNADFSRWIFDCAERRNPQ